MDMPYGFSFRKKQVNTMAIKNEIFLAMKKYGSFQPKS